MFNVKTSYYAKYKKPDGISVSRSTPKWFRGNIIIELCPDWWLIKGNYNDADFTRLYYEHYLKKLDPRVILKKVNNKVMLCYEKPPDFCHRRVIAKWIEKETGVVVPEYGIDSEPKTIEQLAWNF